MQFISNDKTVRSNTIQYIKVFNSQLSATQTKGGEQIVSMMPAIKRTFDLMGDDVVELSTKSESLINKIGSQDKKMLEETESKLLKQFIDEKGQTQLCHECKNR